MVDGERLVGIFTERDALFRVVAACIDPAKTPIGAVMTASPVVRKLTFTGSTPIGQIGRAHV